MIYDLAVIGSGPGGYVCAIRAAQLGLKTVCIEKGELGGVCLNVGCIPSKALIHASKTFYKAKHGAHMGIMAAEATVDMTAMQQWKSGIVTKLTGGIGALFKGNGVERRAATARIDGRAGDVFRVQLTDATGATSTLEAHYIVLATGSAPIEIGALPYGEAIVHATGALAFETVPARLAVVGGGVIGMELADVYARLGAQVTVIEALDRLLAIFDADLVRPVQLKQKKLGVKHLVDARVVGHVAHADGSITLEIDQGGGAKAGAKTGDKTGAKTGAKANAAATRETVRLDFDKVLVSVGRRPNTANLGLETVGLSPDAHGFLAVDAQQRTAVEGLFAIGDIAPGPMLAHKASYEGEVAAEAIAGHPAANDAACVPSVVYTDPEIATVGPTLTELVDQAKKDERSLQIGKFPMAALGRAIASDATEGFVRVVADSDTGELLAVHIVAAEASELINAAGFSLEMAASTEDVALTMHAHPSLAEGFMEAAKAALGQAIHQVNR